MRKKETDLETVVIELHFDHSPHSVRRGPTSVTVGVTVQFIPQTADAREPYLFRKDLSSTHPPRALGPARR